MRLATILLALAGVVAAQSRLQPTRLGNHNRILARGLAAYWWLPTEAGSTATDLSGNGNTLTKAAGGSAPTSTALGWEHATQYAMSPAIAGLSMTADFQVQFVGVLKNGSNLNAFSLANPATNVDSQQVREINLAAGTEQVVSRDSTGQNFSTNDGLVFPPGAHSMATLGYANGVLTLTRMDTGGSVSVASLNPTGTPRFGIGAVARLAPTIITDALTSTAAAIYTSSDMAIARHNYRAFQWLAKGAGIVLP